MTAVLGVGYVFSHALEVASPGQAALREAGLDVHARYGFLQTSIAAQFSTGTSGVH